VRHAFFIGKALRSAAPSSQGWPTRLRPAPLFSLKPHFFAPFRNLNLAIYLATTKVVDELQLSGD
jgi:hypothetical protein